MAFAGKSVRYRQRGGAKATGGEGPTWWLNDMSTGETGGSMSDDELWHEKLKSNDPWRLIKSSTEELLAEGAGSNKCTGGGSVFTITLGRIGMSSCLTDTSGFIKSRYEQKRSELYGLGGASTSQLLGMKEGVQRGAQSGDAVPELGQLISEKSGLEGQLALWWFGGNSE